MFRVSFTFIVFLVLAGCNYYERKDKSTFSGGAVGYPEIRDQILVPNCLGCHSGNHEPMLTTYAQVMGNLDKIQSAVMVKKTMPKRGPLDTGDMAILGKWIADGGPEVGPSTKPPPDLGNRPVKWATLKQKVLNGRCFICHYLNNPDKVSNLDDLESFRGTIGTSYFLAVISPAMPPPPKGTPAGDPNPNELTHEEKQLLSDWLVDGMQN